MAPSYFDLSFNELPDETEALCPVFRRCGGCRYQHLHYATELDLKQKQVRHFLSNHLPADISSVLKPIVASPKNYHYRSRLDLVLRQTKSAGVLIGFMEHGKHVIVPITDCSLAEPSISKAIPEVQQEAIAKLPAKYRAANLTIKTGEDGRVLWGGIGKGSLKIRPEEYLFTRIDKKILYYGLESFFQANLSILPLVKEKLGQLEIWSKETLFLDLYGGVGLFSVLVADWVGKVLLVEENATATHIAAKNFEVNRMSEASIYTGRMEEVFSKVLPELPRSKKIAMIDPPRGGLSEPVLKLLCGQDQISTLLYLSCNPDALLRDLTLFLAHGWQIKTLIPFDFFPRTHHLEILAVLERA